MPDRSPAPRDRALKFACTRAFPTQRLLGVNCAGGHRSRRNTGKELLKADRFGPMCMQSRVGARPVALQSPMSEDCLYLNIWTAAKLAKTDCP